MKFRRSEFDVTNRINTTDPACVKLEVARIFRGMYARTHAPAMSLAFDDMVRLYRGEYAGYTRCDTQYHDLQHVLEVTLAMARLLDGYERVRGEGPSINDRQFQLGVICALYHDCGYIRRDNDRKHRNGAEYTQTHVSRGGRFLREYLPRIGMGDMADLAAEMLHFTGYEKPIASIRVPPVFRLVGSLLGSADIIAQMSDRCYLEKCRDRLYPEFVAGGLACRPGDDGEPEVVFASGEDLLLKTPTFYAHATRRLDEELDGAYRFAQAHFGGSNFYMDALKQNIRFVERIGAQGEIVLRRQPPVTV